MEIFCNELPKKGACFNGCPYAVTDTWVYYCPFQQEENGDHLIVKEDCISTCPLKLLKDALAEERKKVVQEIKKLVIESTCYDTEEEVRNQLYDMSAGEVLKILDQIERSE